MHLDDLFFFTAFFIAVGIGPWLMLRAAVRQDRTLALWAWFDTMFICIAAFVPPMEVAFNFISATPLMAYAAVATWLLYVLWFREQPAK